MDIKSSASQLAPCYYTITNASSASQCNCYLVYLTNNSCINSTSYLHLGVI